MSKQVAVQNAQRFAFQMLSKETIKTKKGDVPNPYYVNPKNITVPAQIIQEQQLVNTNNTYTFDFSNNAPQPSDTLNNVLLGNNNIASVYGIQVYLGEGATVSNRVYRTYGNLAADNVFYNGNTQVKYEQSTFVTNLQNSDYYKYDGVNRDQYDGLVLMQPLRVISGRLGINQVIMTLPKVSTLTFTANLFISVRLCVAFGQPNG